MKTILLSFALILVSVWAAFGQYGGRNGHRHHHHNRRGNRVVVVRPAVRPMPVCRGPFYRNRIVVVRPRRARTCLAMGPGFVTIGYRGVDYYWNQGWFYRPAAQGFISVCPPRGIRVRMLPPGFFVLAGPVPTYYANGSYYREVGPQEYEVVEPMMGAVVPNLPEQEIDEVQWEGQTFYEYDNTLYRQVSQEGQVGYEVVGFPG